MSADRWAEVKPLLDACAELPDPDQRNAFLDRACAEDPGLRREVESYLAYEDELSSLSIAVPAGDLVEALDEESAEEGRRIGPFRIVELLGKGGMGAVYLAHREEDFEQKVALKLVRAGIETPEVLRRFHTERQILARLAHPNVARLLDGGTTDDGRPYFVMELIEGQPIDRYCDERSLSTRERLALVLQVCDALSFAHRNLVLHLDLKPGNILVTDEGVPKLLDFGIGKLLRKEREPASSDDSDESHAMTLGYASPEQLQAEPLSTDSDLYSLGVVIYELLTGKLPCVADLESRAAMIWSICHEPPTLPSLAVLPTELERSAESEAEVSVGGRPRASDSAGGDPGDPGSTGPASSGAGENRGLDGIDPDVLTTLEAGMPTLDPEPRKAASSPSAEARAALRGRTAKGLSRRLKGDLDAILLEALQKEPADRYASVERLAADLRRFLNGYPVRARRGNFVYSATKYLIRNRWRVAVAATILGLILGFTAALSNQLDHTRRAKERSDRLAGFLVGLFQAAEPDRSGEDPTVRELVDIGRQRLATELEEDPEVRGDLLGTLGQVYYRLGHLDAATETHEAAIEALAEQGEDDHPLIGRALNDLSAIAFARGDYATAERFCRQSIEMRQRLGADQEELTKPRNNLATMLMRQGKLDEAEQIYRAGLEWRKEKLGDRHPNVAVSLRHVANVLTLKEELEEAEVLLRESLDIRIEAYGADAPTVATVMASLARLAYAQGQLDEAESLFRRALEVRRHRLGPWHPNVATVEKDYAKLLLDLGEVELAGILLANASVPIYRDTEEGSWIRADLEIVYGAYLAAVERIPEARVCLEQGHRALSESRGTEHPLVRSAAERLERFYGEHGHGGPTSQSGEAR